VVRELELSSTCPGALIEPNAARRLTLYAAREAEAGRRADMEAGMVKLFASETAMQITLNAVRMHGGYGYSTEFDASARRRAHSEPGRPPQPLDGPR
jgi:alkylation response protein AidB-like acyl-CoA dehydrogenase